jgi:hypothetical protein
MQDAIVAIVVRRHSEGWRWTLLSPVGAVKRLGLADSQEGAMEAAWRAAVQNHGPRRSFPEITVDYRYSEDRAA